MTKPTNNVADMMPDELKALRVLTREFMDRFSQIKSEQEVLKEDEKSLIEEYSEKLDMKTLKAAMRVVKIQSQVAHKDAFDNFIEVLTSSTNSD